MQTPTTGRPEPEASREALRGRGHTVVGFVLIALAVTVVAACVFLLSLAF